MKKKLKVLALFDVESPLPLDHCLLYTSDAADE